MASLRHLALRKTSMQKDEGNVATMPFAQTSGSAGSSMSGGTGNSAAIILTASEPAQTIFLMLDPPSNPTICTSQITWLKWLASSASIDRLSDVFCRRQKPVAPSACKPDDSSGLNRKSRRNRYPLTNQTGVTRRRLPRTGSLSCETGKECVWREHGRGSRGDA